MARLATRDTHEKRTEFEAAPAASIAGDVGRRIDRNILFMALVREIFSYRVKKFQVYASVFHRYRCVRTRTIRVI